MGNSRSIVQNSFATNYTITGNNNGLSSGTQSIGSANSAATTDVSPRTDLNYSTAINPSWIGTIKGVGRGLSKRLQGTVGINTDLIQTIKHVGATAIRTAMGDGDIVNKTKTLVNTLLDNFTPEGAISSKQQIDLDVVKEVVDLQAESVNRMSDAHDAYQTLSLGMTGMRNLEVSTNPTETSVRGVLSRANALEIENKRAIVEVAGPKMGILPVGVESPPSDYLINSFDNAHSKYGRLSLVKQRSEEIYKQQQSILFSILHNSATNLAGSGVLRPFSIETDLFIGNLKQVSVPFTALSYPDGHQFSPSDLITPSVEIKDLSSGQTMSTKFALSSYAYNIPFQDNSREVRVALSGQVVISRQPYDPTEQVRLGFLFKRNGMYYFSSAVLINTDVTVSTKVTAQQTSGSQVLTTTNVARTFNKESGYINADYNKLLIQDPLKIYTRNNFINASPQTLKQQRVNEMQSSDSSGQVARFSYSSQWQVVTNLSNCEPIKSSEIFSGLDDWDDGKEFRAVFVATYPSSLNMSVSVFTPTIQITTVQMPTEMRYQGNKYYSNVIELLGDIPDWYTTADEHDPWFIYRKVISPLINYAGRIAQLHVSTGAAYNLTKLHVERARVSSGLSSLTNQEMKEHIIEIITGIAKWMSDAGPITLYSRPDRKMLFMHICEKVMFQSLTHIKVFSDEIGLLTQAYLADCNEFNAVENNVEQNATVSGDL